MDGFFKPAKFTDKLVVLCVYPKPHFVSNVMLVDLTLSTMLSMAVATPLTPIVATKKPSTNPIINFNMLAPYLKRGWQLMSTTTSEVWPVIRRRAVTGEALRPASSHKRVASMTCWRDMAVTSASYTNATAGILETDVIGTFCGVVGGTKTCWGFCCGLIAHADTAKAREAVIINFFIFFPCLLEYIEVVCYCGIGHNTAVYPNPGLLGVGKYII